MSHPAVAAKVQKLVRSGLMSLWDEKRDIRDYGTVK